MKSKLTAQEAREFFAAGMRGNKIKSPYSHIGRGWREIAGKRIYFKSKAEANWARYLQYLKEKGKIRNWIYEPRRFKFSQETGTNIYIPDFQVFNIFEEIKNIPGHCWHEVKGHMDRKSKTKINRFKKQYPEESLRIVMHTEVAEVGSLLGRLIENWEF